MHEIHRVLEIERVAPHTLRLVFEDQEERVIDFSSVLCGELFGPLADSDFFDRVLVDEEVGTVVWPNGADFDPAMLYNWSDCGPALAALASTWRS